MISSCLAAVSRFVSGVSVSWHCDPHGGQQRIYFSNHTSHLDFIVIWSALPSDIRLNARPVAGRDYWNRGRIRRRLATRVFHAVLVERTHSCPGDIATAARISVERMARQMGSRDSLIVFPEGTRSVNGEIGRFKSGIYHLSRLRPDVELIPVYLENLNRILPKGEALPVPMLSRVVFGERLETGPDDSKDEFLEKARAAVIQLSRA